MYYISEIWMCPKINDILQLKLAASPRVHKTWYVLQSKSAMIIYKED